MHITNEICLVIYRLERTNYFYLFHRGEAKIFFHVFTYIYIYISIHVLKPYKYLMNVILSLFSLCTNLIDHCLFRLNTTFSKIIQR